MELEISTDDFDVRIYQMSLLAWNELADSSSSRYGLEAYGSMYSFGIADLSNHGAGNTWLSILRSQERMGL